MNIPALVIALACGVASAALWLYRRWDDSDRAAERRWKANNRQAKAAGCRCGRPATEVRYDHGTTGRVPHETWTCIEHAGVSMWTGDGTSVVPLWPRPEPCATCTGRCATSAPIGGPPDTWHCPNRPGGGQVTELVRPEQMDPVWRNIGGEEDR